MTKKHFLLFLLGIALLALPVFASSARAPLFLTGDGKIKIKNRNNGRYAEVTYLNADGTLIDEAFRKIDHVFGFPTDMMGENISRRTVAFLDYFADRYDKNAVIYLVSGYRSQDYNNALRARGATAAKTSTHIDGMAIDFSLPGVNGKTLWEDMRTHNCCGAGYYYGNVVHLDSGRPRFWTTETSKVHTGESDFNRYLYASTEYDRYVRGQGARLLFTSVSDFGFGVKSNAILVRDEAGEDGALELELVPGDFKGPSVMPKKSSCHMIRERKDGRFLWLKLPEKTKPGRYRVRVDFCEKPFSEMPDFRVTNEIEIL